MPLAFGENLFGRRDVRETPAGTSTSTSSTSIIAPIGSIMAWLKSFTNTPQTLPTGWMECDGSAISDADSVYDGQNAPDLNGGEFIRGAATSGSTGGSDTIDNHNAIAIDNHTALTLNTDGHTHSVSGTTATEAQGCDSVQSGSGDTVATCNHTHTWSDTSDQDTHGHTFNQDIDAHVVGTNIDAHSTNLPSYYEVVWIFRFK